MSATVKLSPGQKGTKRLVAEHGASLLCVRYRYDSQSRTRLKTVELIIEKKPWEPTSKQFQDAALVPVHIEYNNKILREKAKSLQGKWDPKARAWYIRFDRIRGTELEKFIIA